MSHLDKKRCPLWACNLPPLPVFVLPPSPPVFINFLVSQAVFSLKGVFRLTSCLPDTFSGWTAGPVLGKNPSLFKHTSSLFVSSVTKFRGILYSFLPPAPFPPPPNFYRRILVSQTSPLKTSTKSSFSFAYSPLVHTPSVRTSRGRLSPPSTDYHPSPYQRSFFSFSPARPLSLPPFFSLLGQEPKSNSLRMRRLILKDALIEHVFLLTHNGELFFFFF